MTTISKKRTLAVELSQKEMPQEKPTASARTVDPDGEGAASLDKVRDILFGAQSREYEKRFGQLEERLLKEASDLRRDLKSRFDSLETFVKGEVAAIAERMKQEQHEKSASLKVIDTQLKECTTQLQERIAQVDDHANEAHRTLRQQALDQHKALSQEIQQKSGDLVAMVEKAVGELQGEKLDRAALAELFMESALRINNAFKLPTKE